MRRLIVLTLFLCIAVSNASAQKTHRVPFDPSPGFIGWVEDELIVVFKPQVRREITISKNATGTPVISLVAVQRLVEELNVEKIRRQFPTAISRPAGSPYPDLTGHYKIKLPRGTDLDEAVSTFESNLDVEHVEKIGLHTLSLEPNDPYFVTSPDPNFNYDQWHLWDTHGIHADKAWDAVNPDNEVVVGILDSGVRYYHWDLGGYTPAWGPGNPQTGGNIWVNGQEIPGNSIDDDGNGYTDDVVGWDFVTQAGDGLILCLDVDCVGADNNPDDGNGHGTHMAGVVAGIGNNGWAVAGIGGGYAGGTVNGPAYGVKVLPLRVGFHAFYLGLITGVVRMDWAAEAMNYVADLVDAGANVTAINCSWSASNSGGLDAAVDNLLAHDVMIVHAAGNDNSTTPDFLGSKAGVMNVTSTERNGAGASFSNHGPWVDIAAPGIEILSTSHVPTDPDPTHHYIGLRDGTSASVPQVVGIAALLESCNPSLSGPDKFNLIVNNTSPYTDTRDLGSGIADAEKALAAAGCTPAPTGVEPIKIETASFSWAYPNPFSPATGLFFQIDEPSNVELIIYDVKGRVVRNLISQRFFAGTHRVVFDGLDDRGESLASGVYFYRITAGRYIERKKVVLIR